MHTPNGIDAGLLSSFSALQRAENSSIPDRHAIGRNEDEVSVLFSEPKIPQSYAFVSIVTATSVSVLFSEPKIPQSSTPLATRETSSAFQCSSASRKFLNLQTEPTSLSAGYGFSALQRAENSSIAADDPHLCFNAPVSVLFSEPKIPQFQKRVSNSTIR